MSGLISADINYQPHKVTVKLRSEASKTAELFAIGSELCFGKICDTNSFWMADHLTKLGVQVQRITCLTDDLDNITSAVRDSLSRSPAFLFLSGGLGPTKDDMTIEALSRVTGVPTRVDLGTLQRFAEREKVPLEKLDKTLTKMAVTLVGAECLSNPVGWAPATHLKFGRTEVFALPGPPAEMKGLFSKHVSRIVGDRTGLKSRSSRFVATMYEEELSALTDPLAAKKGDVYIKPLVSAYKPDTGLPLEILVFGISDDECQRKMRETVDELGELVSSRGRTLRRVE